MATQQEHVCVPSCSEPSRLDPALSNPYCSPTVVAVLPLLSQRCCLLHIYVCVELYFYPEVCTEPLCIKPLFLRRNKSPLIRWGSPPPSLFLSFLINFCSRIITAPIHAFLVRQPTCCVSTISHCDGTDVRILRRAFCSRELSARPASLRGPPPSPWPSLRGRGRWETIPEVREIVGCILAVCSSLR